MTNDVLQRNTIRRVYNTPELHGSYCPCKGCESILGPRQVVLGKGRDPLEERAPRRVVEVLAGERARPRREAGTQLAQVPPARCVPRRGSSVKKRSPTVRG